MEDMTEEDWRWALPTHVSRRVEKLGKAFQNWRRAQLHRLEGMKIKKVTFLAWRVFLNEEKVERGESRTEEVPVCEEDLLWTEDDMDHFLHTVASFETHKRIWKEKLEKRRLDPYDNNWGKAMPRMIPPSYVRLFQITLSQVHSAKFRQHFGAAAMDGTLVQPFHMHEHENEEMWVAESAARRKRFEVDTRIAIDSKILENDDVAKVQNYRGKKLWMFVMKRVRATSPVTLRMGCQQILGAALKRWREEDQRQQAEQQAEQQADDQPMEDWSDPEDLDEALDDLMPPPSSFCITSSHLVHPADPGHQLGLNLRQKVDVLASSAHSKIDQFRVEVLGPIIEGCMRWIQLNMREFQFQSVELFGSKCYHLQLCSSDADIIVILPPGKNSKSWLDQLCGRIEASRSFTSNIKRYARFDCAQTEFLGVPVDIKVIKNNRARDGACRSTDILTFMIETRFEVHDRRAVDDHGFHKKHVAILIFKLLCHSLNVIGTTRAGKFKAVTICYWAVAMLDFIPLASDVTVADFISSLCNMFLTFNWEKKKGGCIRCRPD